MEEQNVYMSNKTFRQLFILLMTILLLEIVLVAMKFWPWVEKMSKRDLIDQRYNFEHSIYLGAVQK